MTVVAACQTAQRQDESPAQDPETIFAQRLMPIFASDNPSSCVECHLAGVQLKNYILPSHRDTFISLRDGGMIDLEDPKASRILAFINMGRTKAPHGGARLLPTETRQAEYDAFVEWITASVRDPDLVNAPSLQASTPAGPERSPTIIRHARKDRVVRAFEKSIWGQRLRCAACHAASGEQNAKLVEEHGRSVTWILADPESTLDYLAKTNVIDVDDPADSELLTKPTLVVEHEGGKKMDVGDFSYKVFRNFIEDYARTVNDTYVDAQQLPTVDDTVQFVSDNWLKIEQTPPEWGEKVLLVKLFARRSDGKFSNDPIAIADRTVWGQGKLWQQTLILLAPTGSASAQKFVHEARLPPGDYLMRVYVDKNGKLAENWQAELTSDDLVGQAQLESWTPGYGKMAKLPARSLLSARKAAAN